MALETVWACRLQKSHLREHVASRGDIGSEQAEQIVVWELESIAGAYIFTAATKLKKASGKLTQDWGYYIDLEPASQDT